MFEATTENIKIEVHPTYFQEESDPKKQLYCFRYKVKITNLSSVSVQLMQRHWIIIDGAGQTEEVHGPGVVGQQPIIDPGMQFEYESFCPLPTPTGSMHGSYEMVRPNGDKIDVLIPQFLLVEPSLFH